METGFFLSAICYLLFLLSGLFLVGPYFSAQTDIETIARAGRAYMRICLVFSFGMVLQVAFEHLLQAGGRMLASMSVSLTAVLVNVVLDPVLIYGLFGLPAMGVTGAAVATVIAQCLAACLGIYLFFGRRCREFSGAFRFRTLRPDFRILRRILSIGLPMTFRFFIYILMVFSLNKTLIAHSVTATAVCGIFLRLQGLFFFPLVGVAIGISPLISYNFGNAKPERLKNAVRLGLSYSLAIGAVAAVLLYLLAPIFLSLFGASADVAALGVPALRKVAPSFIPAGFSVCAVSICIAVGRGLYGFLLSVSRQLLFLIPAALYLVRQHGISEAWWAFPIADSATMLTAIVLLRRIYREEIVPMVGETDGSCGRTA